MCSLFTNLTKKKSFQYFNVFNKNGYLHFNIILCIYIILRTNLN